MLYSCAPVATTSFLAMGCEAGESPSVLWMDFSCMTGCRSACGVAYQDLSQVVIGDVGQLLAVDLGDYELRIRGKR